VSRLFELGKFVSSAGLLAVGLTAGWQGLFVPQAERALMGRRVIALRSPIEGLVERAEAVEGALLAADSQPYQVKDPRAETARSAELTQRQATLQGELAALERATTGLKSLQSLYRQRDSTSRSVQIAQLKTLLTDARANATARESAASASAAEGERSQTLLELGLTTQRQLEQAQSAEKVAAAQAVQAANQAQSLDAVLGAVSAGVPIDVTEGGAFTYARHKADEVALLLMNREQELLTRRALLAATSDELAAEQRRIALRAQADIGPGARARVWKRLVSRGEFVRSGQTLAEALDCSEAMITSVVSARTASKIRIGATATVKLAGDETSYSGVVTSLGGYTAATAIGPVLDAPPAKPGDADELLLAVIRVTDSRLRKDCAAGSDADVRF
jgi:hypothetical protein